VLAQVIHRLLNGTLGAGLIETGATGRVRIRDGEL
jgi:hypothetical protein